MKYDLIDFDTTFRGGTYISTGTYKHDESDPFEKPIRLVFVGCCVPPYRIYGFLKEVKIKEKLVRVFEYSKKRGSI